MFSHVRLLSLSFILSYVELVASALMWISSVWLTSAYSRSLLAGVGGRNLGRKTPSVQDGTAGSTGAKQNSTLSFAGKKQRLMHHFDLDPKVHSTAGLQHWDLKPSIPLKFFRCLWTEGVPQRLVPLRTNWTGILLRSWKGFFTTNEPSVCVSVMVCLGKSSIIICTAYGPSLLMLVELNDRVQFCKTTKKIVKCLLYQNTMLIISLGFCFFTWMLFPFSLNFNEICKTFFKNLRR